MELRIETKSWKLTTAEKGSQKIIAGTYAVKCGKETVAEKSFNDGYGALDITIPAAIIAKAEEIDKEIRQCIVDSFKN